MGVKKLNLAIFISGRGSNMRSIIEACKTPDYPATVNMVLSNRPDAPGLDYAAGQGIKTEIVDHKLFATREAFESEIQEILSHYKVDLIALAGFLRILTPGFIEKWPQRIINVHPSLLPDYKGLNTHERAIADGKKEAGCTIHYVVPEIDSGEIILQKRVPILPGDTPGTLAERVVVQEHSAYPEAIRIVANSGKIFS
jgi:phosphoribosylglycinamide formyltransferase-1